MKKAWQGYLMIAPLLAGCLLFTIWPFVSVFRYSLFQDKSFVGMKNYFSLVRNSSFRLAFGNSLRFLAVGLPMVLFLAYSIALMIKAQAERHQLLKAVFFLPYVTPVAGTVLVVELIFKNQGELNALSSILGLPVQNWLSGRYAFWIAIVLYLWKNTGYAAILLLAGLVIIPKEQYESARMDGAGTLQCFLFITTPQMWNSVFFSLVFSVINAFKCFREIFLLGGAHPSDSLYMLQHFINNSFENLSYSKLSVCSVLLMAVILAVFGVFYLFLRHKEAE